MLKQGINDLSLNKDQKDAILEVKQELTKHFPVERIIVFGSVARGTAGEESDLDLLIITREIMTHRDRNAISGIIFEANYRYSTNLSMVVVDAASWNMGILSLTPLYSEVQRDGVII